MITVITHLARSAFSLQVTHILLKAIAGPIQQKSLEASDRRLYV